MSTTPTVNQFLFQDEASAFLRRPMRTLEHWRTVGSGPRFVKMGRRVLYRSSDLEQWVEKQTRTHTGAA